MMKCIAIDDEPPALMVLESFCKQYGQVKLERTFTRPTEAIKYLNKFPVDFIFLDIRMPSVDGLKLYSTLQQQTRVIFTTAYSEYAVEGFNLNAVDYLLKPYTYERFEQAVKKMQQLVENDIPAETSGAIFIRADYSLVKIEPSEILFVEGFDDYLKIHIEGKKTLVARMTLKKMLEKLPGKSFIRVHRSFIIPIDKVTSVRNKLIYIGEHQIPVGSNYEEEVFSLFR